MHRISPPFALLGALAATAVAGLPQAQAAVANPKPGAYTGTTSQGYSIKVAVEGRRRQFIRRITVKGGRFHIVMSDLDMRGHFVARTRMEGRFTIKGAFNSCPGTASYHAVRR